MGAGGQRRWGRRAASAEFSAVVLASSAARTAASPDGSRGRTGPSVSAVPAGRGSRARSLRTRRAAAATRSGGRRPSSTAATTAAITESGCSGPRSRSTPAAREWTAATPAPKRRTRGLSAPRSTAITPAHPRSRRSIPPTAAGEKGSGRESPVREGSRAGPSSITAASVIIAATTGSSIASSRARSQSSTGLSASPSRRTSTDSARSSSAAPSAKAVNPAAVRRGSRAKIGRRSVELSAGVPARTRLMPTALASRASRRAAARASSGAASAASRPGGGRPGAPASRATEPSSRSAATRSGSSDLEESRRIAAAAPAVPSPRRRMPLTGGPLISDGSCGGTGAETSRGATTRRATRALSSSPSRAASIPCGSSSPEGVHPDTRSASERTRGRRGEGGLIPQRGPGGARGAGAFLGQSGDAVSHPAGVGHGPAASPLDGRTLRRWLQFCRGVRSGHCGAAAVFRPPVRCALGPRPAPRPGISCSAV